MKNTIKTVTVFTLVTTLFFNTANADLRAVREYQAEQTAPQKALPQRERTAPESSTEFNAKIATLKNDRKQLNERIRRINGDLATINREKNQKNREIDALASKIQDLSRQIEAADAWYNRTQDRKWLAGKNLQTQAKRRAEQELNAAKNLSSILENKINGLQEEKKELISQRKQINAVLRDISKQQRQQRQRQREQQTQPRVVSERTQRPQPRLSYGQQVANINETYHNKIKNLKQMLRDKKINISGYRQKKSILDQWYRTQLTALKESARR